MKPYASRSKHYSFFFILVFISGLLLVSILRTQSSKILLVHNYLLLLVGKQLHSISRPRNIFSICFLIFYAY